MSLTSASNCSVRRDCASHLGVCTAALKERLKVLVSCMYAPRHDEPHVIVGICPIACSIEALLDAPTGRTCHQVSPGGHQGVIRESPGSHIRESPGVTGGPSGSHEGVMSGSHQGSPGSHQGVIRESSGGHQEAIRKPGAHESLTA